MAKPRKRKPRIEYTPAGGKPKTFKPDPKAVVGSSTSSASGPDATVGNWKPGQLTPVQATARERLLGERKRLKDIPATSYAYEAVRKNEEAITASDPNRWSPARQGAYRKSVEGGIAKGHPGSASAIRHGMEHGVAFADHTMQRYESGELPKSELEALQEVDDFILEQKKRAAKSTAKLRDEHQRKADIKTLKGYDWAEMFGLQAGDETLERLRAIQQAGLTRPGFESAAMELIADELDAHKGKLKASAAAKFQQETEERQAGRKEEQAEKTAKNEARGQLLERREERAEKRVEEVRKRRDALELEATGPMRTAMENEIKAAQDELDKHSRAMDAYLESAAGGLEGAGGEDGSMGEDLAGEPSDPSQVDEGGTEAPDTQAPDEQDPERDAFATEKEALDAEIDDELTRMPDDVRAKMEGQLDRASALPTQAKAKRYRDLEAELENPGSIAKAEAILKAKPNLRGLAKMVDAGEARETWLREFDKLDAEDRREFAKWMIVMGRIQFSEKPAGGPAE